MHTSDITAGHQAAPTPPVNCHAEWFTRTGLLQLLRYRPGGSIYIQHRDGEGSSVIELSPELAASLAGALLSIASRSAS